MSLPFTDITLSVVLLYLYLYIKYYTSVTPLSLPPPPVKKYYITSHNTITFSVHRILSNYNQSQCYHSEETIFCLAKLKWQSWWSNALFSSAIVLNEADDIMILFVGTNELMTDDDLMYCVQAKLRWRWNWPRTCKQQCVKNAQKFSSWERSITSACLSRDTRELSKPCDNSSVSSSSPEPPCFHTRKTFLSSDTWLKLSTAKASHSQRKRERNSNPQCQKPKRNF